MPIAQASKIMKALKPIVDRDIVVFVYHKKHPIAFYVNIPELNEIFKHVHGNLNLLGKLKFLYHKLRRTPQIMVGIVFGVDRAYHGKGIEGAMIKWAEDHIVSLNRYHVTTLTWIGDFNPKMMHVAENLGAELSRTFITYRYLFDREKQFERAPIVE
jgi:GNAT superfamily N-acetyltransferase